MLEDQFYRACRKELKSYMLGLQMAIKTNVAAKSTTVKRRSKERPTVAKKCLSKIKVKLKEVRHAKN